MHTAPSSKNRRRFRVAILGAGEISGPHITALRQLPTLVDVVAVCDLDQAKARAFQEQNGIPAAYESLDTMLAEARPDVVHVLLPPVVHARAAETCLLAGSNVLVEKPFCVSLDECRRVQEVAGRQSLRIGVNHNLTFMPSFLELLEAIRSFRLGAIEYVQVMYTIPMPALEFGPPPAWMFSGTENLLFELGPHPLSLPVRLLGRVTGASTAVSGEMQFKNGVRFFRTWQSSLVHARGASQCTLAVGSGYFSSAVHVVGEDAQAFVDLRRNTFQLIEKTRYARVDDMINGWKNASALTRRSWRNFKAYALGAAGLGPPHLQQIISVNSSVAAFYRALAAGRNPRIDGAEGAAVVEACEMVRDSAFAFLAQKEDQVAVN